MENDSFKTYQDRLEEFLAEHLSKKLYDEAMVLLSGVLDETASVCLSDY